MSAPFEGIFGDSRELRLIQFLLPTKGLEFNISELARETGISRQTMIKLVRKYEKWGILKIASRHGRTNYFVLNENSGFIGALENLNNCIIEQMVGATMLDRIARYSLECIKIEPVRFGSFSHMVGAASEETQDDSGVPLYHAEDNSQYSFMKKAQGEQHVAA